MKETILVGRGDQITEITNRNWVENLKSVQHDLEPVLHFMSEEHHLVRYFVVREMPRLGGPIRPEDIVRELNLSLERTNTILEDLERNLFFLARNSSGAISWAYPVTTANTPHHLTFSSGERLYAA
jgi:hypothetical protein